MPVLPDKKPTFSDASAIARLQPKVDGTGGVWVTNATAGELLLGQQAGLRPLGQVMGTSVFSPGGSYSGSAISGELKFLTGAYHSAQALALERIRAEAKQLNADGVVHIQVRQAVFGKPTDNLLEFSLIGTAVKATPAGASNNREPFLCSVSGGDYYLLRQAGWRPAGLAVGNCAYFALPRYISSFSNQARLYKTSFERTEYSQAISDARRLAMARMEADAQVAEGEGIIGVGVSMQRTHPEKGLEDSGMNIHYFASGTVVARAPAPPGANNAPSSVLVL